MSNPRHPHVPVMAEEVLHYLQVRDTGVYVDLTAGAGGHSERIASLLAGGRLIALDRDREAVAMTQRRLSCHEGVLVCQANYSQLKRVMSECGCKAADGILLDAGVSSMQIDTPERGFSFQADGPLDMRMDVTSEMDAAAWLSRARREEIERALRDYGDVGPAGRIARVICARRDAGRMKRTGDLVDAVREALDFLTSEPAEIRTVFQAVRMVVNEELNHLETGLRQAAEMLAPGGRLVVISFHSGEDRVVKDTFRELTRPVIRQRPDGRILSRTDPLFRMVTPRPVTPSEQETRENSRAKSAKIRVIERKQEQAPQDKEDANETHQ